MANILLRVPVESDPSSIYKALSTSKGVNSWWSNHTKGPKGTGSVMKVSFPDAPMSFDFEVIEEIANERVSWKCLSGPPEWIGTTISLTIETDREGNRSILFDHRGWKTTKNSFPFIAYSWAQILPRLKTLAEEDKAKPFFDF